MGNIDNLVFFMGNIGDLISPKTAAAASRVGPICVGTDDVKLTWQTQICMLDIHKIYKDANVCCILDIHEISKDANVWVSCHNSILM